MKVPLFLEPAPRALRQGATGALLLAAALSASPAMGQTVRQNLWVTNGQVYATAIANNTIYVGGSFTQVGPATGCAVGIDMNSGAAIKPYPMVGSPSTFLGQGQVYAVAPDGNGGWFLGGSFPTVMGQPRSNLAHVDSSGALTSWDPHANGDVRSIAVSGSAVFVGGSFTNIGGQASNYLAALDASTGQAIQTWNANAGGEVKSIGVGPGVLYAGGLFTSIGGAYRPRHLAALDLTTGNATGWIPSVTQLDPLSVNALCLSGGAIYAAGQAQLNGQVGGFLSKIPATGTGTIDPIWAAQPMPLPGTVNAVALDGVTVYAGGDGGMLLAFDAATGNTVTSWAPSVNGAVSSLLAANSLIYMAGSFTSADGQTRQGLAAVDPTSGSLISWNPSAACLYSTYGSANAYALASSGTIIMAGGDFTMMNSQPRNNLAAFDLTSGAATPWDPNSGGEVRAIATVNNTVFVGGGFQSMGGQTRHNVAAVDNLSGGLLGWNPDVWNSVFASEVYALLTNGSTLWIGGKFTSAGGASHANLCSVDVASGTVYSWPASAGGTVYTLAMKGNLNGGVTIFAGGSFTSANGVPRSRIASWDGYTGTLNTLESSANNIVYTMTFSSCGLNCGTLWVGGVFTAIGGVARNHIAAIDAATGVAKSWDPNANGPVYALRIGSPVYVGGNFSTIGGQSRFNIAALSSSTGSASGWDPGAQSEVYTFGVYGGTVFAGGLFNTIGGFPHMCLAGLSDGTVTAVDSDPVVARPAVLHVAPNPFVTQAVFQFTLSSAEMAKVAVYDVSGRLVRRLHDGILSSGERSMAWDGRNDAGVAVASGTYFLRVRTPSQSLSSKIFRLR